ncbi:ROK family transcriptional regulator [Epibacterium ulvae]|nr:ROK family transcriptional regulator [Epibacterium ulvae]MBT8153658.1 ROK family transcriptional regulator [Epibacterium ulvae]
MRAHNERLVLSLIRQMGPQPKAEIARRTKLSAQTVSVIMRALEADGLLEKGTPVRGKVGQPSIPMSLVADGAYFLGLKVGRRSLELILTDFIGTVVTRIWHPHSFPTPDRVVEFTRTGIATIFDELSSAQRDRVAGLGIALPFRIWDWANTLETAGDELDAWRDRDIAGDITAFCEFPVYLQNDASAACGAELVFGDQDKSAEFLYFFIGYFVGGGLVMDNALYTGPTGNAAALGSIPVTDQNGSPRQLVDVASLAELEHALNASGQSGADIWTSPNSWDISDRFVEDWTTSAAQGLAKAIASATCVIDFECVMIDGWMPSVVRHSLVRKVAEQLEINRIAGIDVPEMREGTIGSDARALGAASLPLSNRFLVDSKAILKG